MWLRSFVRRFGTKRRQRPDPFLIKRRLVQNARPVIFDVGAHVGETALRYRSLFRDAAIHCFEPSPDSFRSLEAAVRSDAGIHAHRAALADAAGTAVLNVNRSAATSSLLPTDLAASRYWGKGLLDTRERVEVATQTLDAFCAEHGIARVDILKIDVQGAEYAVLRGATGTLERAAIDVVYMEMITAPTYVGQRKLHDYLALFAEHGYELFDLYNPVRRRDRLIQADALVVSAECLARYEAAPRH